MLSTLDKNNYVNSVIIPIFQNLIHNDVYSCLLDINGVGILCTEKSAKSIGLNGPDEFAGLCYYCNDKVLLNRFFKTDNPDVLEALHRNCILIRKLQQITIQQKKFINFVDLLPYNNQFEAYITIYMPLFHPNGEVVAMQSLAFHSPILGFQTYLDNLNLDTTSSEYMSFNISKAKEVAITSVREREILFLISHNITQEHIAQILQISRSTVASIISNQLCVKFGIAGSNTKLLAKVAIANGFQKNMPSSLWRPAIIITDDELLKQVT